MAHLVAEDLAQGVPVVHDGARKRCIDVDVNTIGLSKNLSNEAKKGIHEMVKRGGTHSYAPLGYHNSILGSRYPISVADLKARQDALGAQYRAAQLAPDHGQR